MALDPSQKASLAIRIVAARYFDGHAEDGICHHVGEPAGRSDQIAITNIARACLQLWIGRAKLELKNDGSVADHLHQTASELERQIAGARQEYANAIELLRHFAAHARPGTGKGPALCPAEPHQLAPAAAGCACGFLDLARLIETRVRHACALAQTLPQRFPEIHYETSVIEDAIQALAPFRVTGSADINSSPRLVRITVVDGDLRAVDLCQISYVLYHELVCHAFQSLGEGAAPENVPASCYWTEGWMDKVAFDMARKWIAEQVREPAPWLPLVGADAEDAIWQVHSLRYADKDDSRDAKLSREIAYFRRLARRALEKLAIAIAENHGVESRSALEIVQEFSLAVNTHPEATPKALRRIARYLVTSLSTKERAFQAGGIAAACCGFLRHRDFAQLEKELAGLDVLG